ncbi:ankyrin repeat-containing protein [Tupanvirus soda lake]|uniref:Ankyrin repeat-containing protein n=2 Tax=Tupanvirus TaxID=2094720 RepID=A0A6N1NTK4_9VIRU|nr:ankyrin repeat-containing protein [Tupanvirus soda lake]QKU34863.1 ankyrin repeat-containing protein [Tupanvirus soda lake]
METSTENIITKRVRLQIQNKFPTITEKNIQADEKIILEHITEYNFCQTLLDYLLQYYTAINNTHFIIVLINIGANIHAEKDKVLTIAVECGHMNCVILYSDLGISIRKNYHLINIIAERGDISMMKYFLSFILLTKKTAIFVNMSLITAIKKNFIDVVKLLIDFGANVHYCNGYPLVMSTKTNNFEISKFLLEHGAHANSQANLPLINAIINKNHQIVELLVEHGAHTNREEIVLYVRENKLYKIAILLSIFVPEME